MVVNSDKMQLVHVLWGYMQDGKGLHRQYDTPATTIQAVKLS